MIFPVSLDRSNLLKTPRCCCSRRASVEPPGRPRQPPISASPTANHVSPCASRIAPELRRGCCPVHGKVGMKERTFSVHLGKNVFQCFQAECGAQGNVLDLWAALQNLTLYE